MADPTLDDYESSRGALVSLSAWHSAKKADRNEATTRFHLIDRLFLECLGWSRDDIECEGMQNGTYCDYCFHAPRRILVVEAKREGDYFELALGRKHLHYGLRALCRDCRELEAAIVQAAQYCQSRGVPYGAVTNGYQIVAFLASRSDGTPPLDGRALVFESFDVMLEEFPLLWESLSKIGVQQKKLQQVLAGDARPQLPSKLSSSIAGYPGIQKRNVLQTDLQLMSELVVHDVLRREDLEAQFLQECYCETGALSQHSLVSKQILTTRYEALFAQDEAQPVLDPVRTRAGISTELFGESISRRPIILLGDTGVGKTMWIRNLMKVKAVGILSDAITVYIDLGSKGSLARELRTFVLEEIKDQLRHAYQIDIDEARFVRGVYNLELIRFRDGIYGELEAIDSNAFKQRELAFLESKVSVLWQHIRAALMHISKGRRKQIVVFLDNADQRNEKTQEEAFLIAQELAEDCPTAVFVSLRPETFSRSQREGTLTGYHLRAFTIAPPRIDHVIKRRLAFALKLTGGQIRLTSLADNIGVKLERLDEFIRIMLLSLEENEELFPLIDNISGGNVRLALDIVGQFFGTGHVDTEKILAIYARGEKYIIPLHEMVRSLIHGDAVYFDPDRSPVANLFDISSVDQREHFLLPHAVCYSETERPTLEGGFVEVARLYDRLQGAGFTPDQVDCTLARALRYRLLEPGPRGATLSGPYVPAVVRPTSVGLYHVNKLACLFTYVDAVGCDTPILNPVARAEVRDVRTIEERLERAVAFARYLDTAWEASGFPQSAFHWPSCSADLRGDCDRIRARNINKKRSKTLARDRKWESDGPPSRRI